MHEIALNRRAYFDYEILDTYEAGIELQGFEVKAAKNGRMNLTGSFAMVRNNQVWLLNATIPPHQPQNAPPNYDPARTRRLLLHRVEIEELVGNTSQKGLTLVPLKVYTKRARIKVLLGLARRKKALDKREVIKRRESRREIERALKRGPAQRA